MDDQDIDQLIASVDQSKPFYNHFNLDQLSLDAVSMLAEGDKGEEAIEDRKIFYWGVPSFDQMIPLLASDNEIWVYHSSEEDCRRMEVIDVALKEQITMFSLHSTTDVDKMLSDWSTVQYDAIVCCDNLPIFMRAGMKKKLMDFFQDRTKAGGINAMVTIGPRSKTGRRKMARTLEERNGVEHFFQGDLSDLYHDFEWIVSAGDKGILRTGATYRERYFGNCFVEYVIATKH